MQHIPSLAGEQPTQCDADQRTECVDGRRSGNRYVHGRAVDCYHHISQAYGGPGRFEPELEAEVAIIRVTVRHSTGTSSEPDESLGWA